MDEKILIPSFKNADREKYKSIISAKLKDNQVCLEEIISTMQIDDMIKDFTNIIGRYKTSKFTHQTVTKKQRPTG
jgi:hypothetical protein